MTEKAVRTYQERFQKLQEVTQTKDQDGSNAFYGEWAKAYTNDVLAVNYKGHTLGAEFLDKYAQKFGFKKDIKILDVAAGSGLVGIELRKRGYADVHASDPCQEILDEAKKNNIYQSYLCTATGNGHKMPIEDQTYDATVIAGALPQIMEDGLRDMIRITKPGGLFVCSGRETYLTEDCTWIEGAIDRMEKEGKLQRIEFVVLDELWYMDKKAFMIVCRVL